MKDLSELRIYRLAVEIGEDVWKIVNSWEDSFAKWTIGKQWVDSSDSISANMMEGYYLH
jgi:four helix bundle protein